VWFADCTSTKTVVKFELLADFDTESAASTVHFDACDNLGAINLRGTARRHGHQGQDVRSP
jgi:hypothetical protein